MVATVGVLALTVAGGARVTSASSRDAGIDAAALPGAGSIRFGTGFDPRSFVLAAANPTFRAGATVYALARLARSRVDGVVVIEVERGGTTLSTQPASLGGEPDLDLLAWTFVPPTTGTYRVVVREQDGRELARGELTAE